MVRSVSSAQGLVGDALGSVLELGSGLEML